MTSAPEHEVSNGEPITVINIFEVPAELVGQFITRWRVRAEIMAAAPGFRDSRMHRAASSQTRFQLVNLAHWDSQADLEAAQSGAAFQDSIRALREDPRMRFMVHPGLYEVAADRPGRSLRHLNRPGWVICHEEPATRGQNRWTTTSGWPVASRNIGHACGR
jgi:heme-degrading monooxygenase HmoA